MSSYYDGNTEREWPETRDRDTERGECPVCHEDRGEMPCSCWDICACGDNRSEHDALTGKSLYNSDCQGFEYDEDATILALSCPPEIP